jgi:hypothetical protein
MFNKTMADYSETHKIHKQNIELFMLMHSARCVRCVDVAKPLHVSEQVAFSCGRWR